MSKPRAKAWGLFLHGTTQAENRGFGREGGTGMKPAMGGHAEVREWASLLP